MAIGSAGIAKHSSDGISWFMTASFSNRNSGVSCGKLRITSILYWFDSIVCL